MTECDGNCSECASEDTCEEKPFPKEPLHAESKIKKVIPIMSGKGGVGKSLVTSLLAVDMQRRGFKVGILDADITGPSIPKMFGITEKPLAMPGDMGMFPCDSKTGIKIMSLNLLMKDPNSPVVWRGPILAGMVKRFWTEVIWGELDYLFLDLPPGTGDVPLTVFQSLPVDGAVIVTSPQQLVGMIVKKAYNMAKMMNIPLLGLVENMSYISCPKCDEVIYPFGKGKTEDTAKELDIKFLGNIPIDPAISSLGDAGNIEDYQFDFFSKLEI